MQVGDLVKFIPKPIRALPEWDGKEEDPRISIGIYLGDKSYNNYKCSLVWMHNPPKGLKNPRPVQTDLLHPITLEAENVTKRN